MQLIRDVEQEPRGVYCGAIGVVAPRGQRFQARFSVAIRTATVDRLTGAAVYGTGGGITWASNPEAEHAELLAKAVILSEPYEEFELLETMAHIPPAGVRHLDRHLQRMADSANYFGFRFDVAQARDRMLDAVAGHGPARVRILLSRAGTLQVELGAIAPPSTSPVGLVVDVDPVDSTQRWLRHKTTLREVYTSRAARHPHADDVLMTNERGQVTETTIANIAARLDGR
jgi:para-aminobenzoate synthetase/4-amino-4-deoxychorismate lyase